MKRDTPHATPPHASERLKIGISACFFHPDPTRRAAPSKTLQWVEQSTAHWVMAGGALPVMIPSPAGDTARGYITLAHYAQWLDGVVMHGGADLWPGSYGEEPLRPEWAGDRVRDEYEIALVRAFMDAGKPVFGICRGLQLINVAFGGSLYQDIATQRPEARLHRDAGLYDRLFHEVGVVPGSRLDDLLGSSKSCTINSVHHQAIKQLAPGLVAEAHCPEDGTIEAIRHTGSAWVAAVQWHPELHVPQEQAQGAVLDDSALLRDFLEAARAARSTSLTP
jgi:putative glutamine amidotransferase